jgi:L-threonylcarbamoyladenylate synthase
MTECEKTVQKARDVVRSGGVVIVPTETFYGLAADPFNEKTVLRIFQIKSRSHFKPLPLIAADRSAVERLVPNPGPEALRLMDRFWPGSLTILLKTTVPLSKLLTGEGGKVGVRIPPDCAARWLAGAVGGLITATSANFAGEPNPDIVQKISASVIAAVDLVVDLGASPGGKPSTVIDLEYGKLRVIREGAVAAKEIESFMRTSKSP